MDKLRLAVAASVAAIHATLFGVQTSRIMPEGGCWLRHYDSDHLARISLPLGGIGTGTVGLGGRGELRDWEIMNRPARLPRLAALRRRRMAQVPLA